MESKNTGTGVESGGPLHGAVMSTVQEIRKQADEMSTAVQRKDPQDVARILRVFFERTRASMGSVVFSQVLGERVFGDANTQQLIREALQAASSLSTPASSSSPSSPPPSSTAVPALSANRVDIDADDVRQMYFQLIATVFLLDQASSQPALLEIAARLGTAMVQGITESSRRVQSALFPRMYFYYYRAHELQASGVVPAVVETLQSALQVSQLRGDVETVIALVNLLLRHALAQRQFSVADKLLAQVHGLSVEGVSGNQLARFYYYQGRLRATQLEYASANELLESALRKSPQTHAYGFRMCVTKLWVIVKLLRGEIPQRAVFRQPKLAAGLRPYRMLCGAVYASNLEAYHTVLRTHEAQFTRDGNFTLVQRVHHALVRKGLRNLCSAYSRIRFSDVAARLGLSDALDAELIVAKAIHDRVIDATLNHDEGYMMSREVRDVYATLEPRDALHARASVCMTLYSDAVQAMHPISKHSSRAAPSDDSDLLLDAADLVDEDEDEDMI